MFDPKFRGSRHISAQAARLHPTRDNRLTLALVALISLATMSVMATTNSVSRQHAEQVQLQR
jgi:hypothetical protein